MFEIKDEEIETWYGVHSFHLNGLRSVSQHTRTRMLKDVVEWLEEPCLHNWHADDLNTPKHGCEECIAELKAEAEKGK